MRRLKWILIIVLLLAVLGGGGAAFFMRDKLVTVAMQLLGKEPQRPAPPAPPPDPNAPPELGTYYSLPSIFATVSAPGHIPHIVHMQVGIYMHEPTDILWVQAYLPRIMDAFQTYLHDDVIIDKTHPIRLDVLREVMLKRINERIAPASITKIVVNSVVIG